MSGKEFEFKRRYLVREVLHSLEEFHLLNTDFLDETLPVVLDIPLHEAVAVPTLRVAVLLVEPYRHVTPINVMTSVSLSYRQDSMAGDTSEEPSFVGLGIACPDEEGESLVGLSHRLGAIRSL